MSIETLLQDLTSAVRELTAAIAAIKAAPVAAVESSPSPTAEATGEPAKRRGRPPKAVEPSQEEVKAAEQATATRELRNPVFDVADMDEKLSEAVAIVPPAAKPSVEYRVAPTVDEIKTAFVAYLSGTDDPELRNKRKDVVRMIAAKSGAMRATEIPEEHRQSALIDLAEAIRLEGVK